MKKLLFFLLLLLSLNVNSQSKSKWTAPAAATITAPAATVDCKCTYPLKNNDQWCTGPRGGIYCINRNGNKTYKPKSK